ncbi:RNA polymerase II transcription factor B 52 kDa subunit [Coemansia erecta]|uniref:RNA polymerase II transcription factor B subunit 2 n=1 Tax=Coemansia erecta TaxID=147472 RepID=A0A9W8CPD4_9FUNG|nr:RNA polymerase II transcription factor B 52 kDa subunit [Coemansia erecta]
MSASEEDFKSTIAEYLESLPEQFSRRVFSNPAACLAIFRLLSTVGKQLIMSMLYLESPIKLQEVQQWARPEHQRTVKSKVHQLRKLHILVEDRGQVLLNAIFREQLRNALTGGGDFSSFGTPCSDGNVRVPVTLAGLAKYADERWEKILHFMVGQSGGETGGVALSESVRRILLESKLMEAEGSKGMRITNSGFQFLLQDVGAQVWTVLLQYLRLAEKQEMDVVEVLNFLFQLVSLQLGRGYSTEALTRNQRKMLGELADFGLMYLDERGGGRFYPTHMVTSLTSAAGAGESAERDGRRPGDSGPLAGDESSSAGRGRANGSRALAASAKQRSSELLSPSDKGYIVVETNCRVYAYTDSPLQIAILNLFVHLVSRFSNFVTGVLTRSSVRRALSHGITADQMIAFLSTHAHPQMQGSTPVLPVTVTDQIRLWEKEKNSLHQTESFLYREFNGRPAFERVYRYAQELNVIQWASMERQLLLVSLQGHAMISEHTKKVKEQQEKQQRQQQQRVQQ